MTKEQLLQLFQDSSEQYGETYEQRAVFDSEFGDLADAILKQPTALDLIAQEREKQISKGRTPESDEKINFECQLARAASDLAYPYENGGDTLPEPPVPLHWDRDNWNRLINKPYKERLIIAGALIVAELDRLNLNEKEVKNG